MIVSCNECIWSTRDGGCSAWNCEYIPQGEAAEAWRKNKAVCGSWLRYGEDGEPNDKDTVFWQCDRCLNTERGRRDEPMRYCPNCGARMI